MPSGGSGCSVGRKTHPAAAAGRYCRSPQRRQIDAVQSPGWRPQRHCRGRTGVTRDRRYGETDYAGRGFRVVDTGGSESVPSSPLSTAIQKQALRAIEESSLVLFVVDAQHGIVAEDREVLDKLRRLGRPILYVANKVDGRGKKRSSAISTPSVPRRSTASQQRTGAACPTSLKI